MAESPDKVVAAESRRGVGGQATVTHRERGACATTRTRLIRGIAARKKLIADPPLRELPSDDYGRFEELTRRLVSELPRAGSGAA